MYYLCICNESYSVSNCIDYARSVLCTSCKHYTYNKYDILRLPRKFLNCTRRLRKIALKIKKYATKHEINTIKVSSDNLTNLPVTFLVENYIENKKNSQCNVFQYFVEFFSVTMREPGRLT